MGKRRTPQQVAADAQAAYRASVVKRHAAARTLAALHDARAAKLFEQSQEAGSKAGDALNQADHLAAELARLDRAAAALAGTDAAGEKVQP